jgi:DNA invertase Pin-like site-specific DNA recombinase
MNVVLYARVSKLNCHQDPEVQLQPLRALAELRGFTVVREFVDTGVSGSKERRPALDELMRAARHGTIDFQAVMVWKWDRFARSTRHLLTALETFDANGIAFISLTESVDTSTPYGKMVFTVLGAVAELERSLIIERVKAGLKKAAAKGRRPGPKITGEPSRTTLWRRRKR